MWVQPVQYLAESLVTSMNSFPVHNVCVAHIWATNIKLVAAHSVLLKQALPTWSTSGGIQGVSVVECRVWGIKGRAQKPKSWLWLMTFSMKLLYEGGFLLKRGKQKCEKLRFLHQTSLQIDNQMWLSPLGVMQNFAPPPKHQKASLCYIKQELERWFFFEHKIP